MLRKPFLIAAMSLMMLGPGPWCADLLIRLAGELIALVARLLECIPQGGCKESLVNSILYLF